MLRKIIFNSSLVIKKTWIFDNISILKNIRQRFMEIIGKSIREKNWILSITFLFNKWTIQSWRAPNYRTYLKPAGLRFHTKPFCHSTVSLTRTQQHAPLFNVCYCANGTNRKDTEIELHQDFTFYFTLHELMKSMLIYDFGTVHR